jgi:hypothetical protein
MYTPILKGEIEPARIANGIDKILAQAIPIAIIERISQFSLGIKYIEINPRPPIVSEIA